MANKIFTELLDLQTRLYNNVLADVSDTAADTRASNNVNHIKWLAGHLVSARYLMSALLGAPQPEKYGEIYGQFKGLQAGIDYPPLQDLKNEWGKITGLLRPLIAGATTETMGGPIPFPIPVTEQNVSGFITFTLHHEAYHIGQLGLLRKYHGYEPMSYK